MAGAAKLLLVERIMPERMAASSPQQLMAWSDLTLLLFVNGEERRTRLRSQLAAGGGGPLGVDSVKEVLTGTANLERTRYPGLS
jgi:hypothetical protein